MRIAQIINSFGLQRGGAERLVQDLHLDLLDKGIDAHLLAIEPSATSGVPNSMTLALPSPYDPRALGRISKWLRGLGHVDVVHAHLFPTSAHITALRMLGVIKCPIIFTEHSTSNRRRQGVLGRIVDPFVYRQFDRIYAISNGARQALCDSYPGLKSRVETIRNGARLRYQNLPDRPKTDHLQILSVGRLTPAKNYETALEAIRGLPDARYSILGGGALRNALQDQININGQADYVTLAGHQTDIEPYLTSGDIFFIPSKWEGFGLAAVEAMNAGMPLVAGDVPGLREVVGQDGNCGFLVDPDQPEAMTTALRKLAGDPVLRERMGANAFERSQLFDKSAMAAEYINAYRDLTGNRDQ